MCNQWFAFFNFLLMVGLPFVILRSLLNRKQYHIAVVSLTIASILGALLHHWLCASPMLNSIAYGFAVAASGVVISAFLLWIKRRQQNKTINN